MTKKVAIYCRLSEEDRYKISKGDDSESIQNQKNMLIKEAVENGWEVYDVYSDEDFAGADRNRPGWKRLLKDAEAGLFDIVLCKSQARFTRESEMVEKYLHYLFPLWGIRFIGTTDHADTNNKGNKKQRQINGLVNEWYIEDLSDNIKAVFKSKKEDGKHIGAFALYGYMKDPAEKGHLIVDEEAAEVVREVFLLFNQGYGKSAIAKILNSRGIPNPTEYKRRKGLRYCAAKSKNSTLWKYFAIADMLVNEMYIGSMVQNKYGSVSYKTKQNKPKPKEEWIIVSNKHEPIIDIDLWNRTQEIITQKAKPFGDTGKVGLFAKKTKCMTCDYTMLSSKNHDKHYLKCGTKHISKDACIGAFVPVAELEKTVLSELRKITHENLDKPELKRQLEFDTQLQAKINKSVKSIQTFTERFEQCSEAVKNLYLDKVSGIITEDEFISLSKDFHDEKTKLEQLIKQENDEIIFIEKRMKSSENKSAILKEYLKIEKLTREHVNALIDCIYIGRRDPITKELPLEIHWNF
jgi:DNA invertase Pin-like site-specific DNA recombinase